MADNAELTAVETAVTTLLTIAVRAAAQAGGAGTLDSRTLATQRTSIEDARVSIATAVAAADAALTAALAP